VVTPKGFLPAELDRRLVDWLPDQAEIVRDVVDEENWLLTVTVQQLCDVAFPTGWELQKDWPELREGLMRVNDYVVLGGDSDPRCGGWDDRGGWRPFALRFAPLDKASTDDLVVLSVTGDRPRR